ncbi:pYEATS domain-containing protein [Roseibium sp. RP-7]
MKTSLHFEAPDDLSIGTVKITGAEGPIADWIATPDRRSFQQDDLKPGLYTAEIGPAGLAPQSVFFQVLEGQANNVILPTFSFLSLSGSNASYFDTSSQKTSSAIPRAANFSSLDPNLYEELTAGVAEIAESTALQELPRKYATTKLARRVTIGLSQERHKRESFDLYKGVPQLDLIAGRLEIIVPCDDPEASWKGRRVRMSMAIENVRIERCLLPQYIGGTRITIAAPPFSPDDLELSVLPADPKVRALVRALDAGTSAEAAAVRDTLLSASGPDRFLSQTEDPWAAMLVGLLAIRFPEVIPPLDAAWTEKLAKRASWAFDAYVIQASQVLASVAYEPLTIPQEAYVSAEDLSRPRTSSVNEIETVAKAVGILAKAQRTGSPYFRYTNQIFGEMAATISDFLNAHVSATETPDQKRFENLYRRWSADLALQRGAGPTFTWLSRDQTVLKERHILVPHRNPSGRLRSKDTTVLFEGEVKAGQISIRAMPPSSPNDGQHILHESHSTQSTVNHSSRELPMPALARPPGPSNDPNKNRFGGRREVDGFAVQAFFEPTKSRSWINIDLVVEAGSERKVELSDIAYFVLHPTFSPPTIKVAFRGRRAKLRVQAWGGFTVGVWLPGPGIELELDLSKLATAPKVIRNN